jgi:hypothetical protein
MLIFNAFPEPMRPIITCCFLFLATSVLAQNKLYLFAGPQATSARYTILNQKQKMTSKYGFQAGINMKTLFEGPIYFAPAAFYSLKGYKVEFTEFRDPPSEFAVNNNTTIHTFELAPLLQVDLSKSASHAFVKFGPTLDFQLFGKETFDTVVNGNRGTVSRNMKFSFTDYGHYSANFLLQFGYESAGGLLVFAQYTHGMGSINNHDEGPKIRHRAYGISIGYLLNRKKIVMDTRNRE